MDLLETLKRAFPTEGDQTSDNEMTSEEREQAGQRLREAIKQDCAKNHSALQASIHLSSRVTLRD